VIQALGGTSVALGLLGGQTGDLWQAEAARRGLAADMVLIRGETRESFCLIDLDFGNVVESVEQGPQVHPSCLSELMARLEQYLPRANLLILSGSLPPGFPTGGYVDMVELAQRHHVRLIADLHGEQLRQILGHKPWLIKPSLAEFEELIGQEISDLNERAVLCQALYRDTGAIIALSMSADGLLVTGPQGQWLLQPPNVGVHLPDGRGKNAIGCGDALVGALAHEYCETQNLMAAATLGVAAAHHNLGTLGVPEINAKGTRALVSSVNVAHLGAS
jgi:1-phosphofructokinase family hexose kinase